MASVDVNSNNTIVTVTETGKEIVSINTPGPQGPQGPPGPSGSSAATDISALNSFTGSAQTSIDALNTFTGSAILSSQTSSMTVATASFAISASHEIIKEVSSSHADVADIANGLQGQPSISVTSITASGNISSSGIIKAFTGSFGRLEGLSPITIGNSATFTQPITGSIFSGSFVGDITAALPNGVLSSSAQISTDISGAFTSTSSSFGTRITANETITSKTLLSSSAQIASDISGAFASPFTSAGISGSFTPASASFSTRVTSLEEGGGGSFTSAGISGSLGPNAVLIRSLTASNISGSFNAASSSFSTRVTSLEAGSGGSFTAAGISGSWQGQNFISASQVTPNLPSGTLSSSAQIALDISGSFNAASSSFSTRVTTNEANITSITSSLDANRVVFTTTGGQLATDAGMTYDSTNDRLTVQSLNVVHLTSSFITASTIQTSGSNIFGDDTTDTQTLIGTTKMTGSAEVTGSLQVKGSGNTFATIPLLIENSDGDDLINLRDSGRISIGLNANNANESNIAYGNSSNAQGSNNIAIGNNAAVQGGQYNIAIGGTVASLNYGIGIGSAYIGGTESVGVGYSSRTSAGTVAIGHDSGPEGAGDGEQSIYIGNEAKGTADNSIVLNANGGSTISSATETNSFKVFMSSASTPDFQVTNTHITASGNISGSSVSTASFGTYLGDGSQLTGISSTPFPFTGDAQITGSLTVSGSLHAFTLDSDSVILGKDAGKHATSNAENNVIIGVSAGISASNDNNVLIGKQAGEKLTGDGSDNIFIGLQAGQKGADKQENVAIGRSAHTGYATSDTSDGNVSIGYYAGRLFQNSTNNIAIGYYAGHGNGSGGSSALRNIFLGAFAGYNHWNGIQDNIYVGYYAGAFNQQGDRNIIIGSGSTANGNPSDQLRIGHADLHVISGSLATGDVIFYNTASAPNFSGSFQGDGSGLTGVGGDSIYTADGTIGSGRGVTLTDTLAFVGGTGIGIGTTPSYLFEVRAAKAATALARVRQTNATGDGLIVRADSTTSTVKVLSVQNNGANQIFNVFADGTSIISGSAQITGSLDVSGSITTFDINMSTWTLGADGGSNYYYFTGPGDLGGTEQNPDIHLIRGQKYRFYNPMNAHPFQIQDLGGSAFNTGVTNNGVSLGFLSFDVPMDGPTHLKYQCTAHAAMVGNIYISDARVASGSFSGSFQGDGSQLTGISTSPFPFTGDAQITGSLIISGSFEAFKLDADDIVLGSGAGEGMTSSDQNNIIIGTKAVGSGNINGIVDTIAIGHAAGENLTTGDNNILIGSGSGDTLTTGYSNIMIGDQTDASTNGTYSSIVIGQAASISAGTAGIAIGNSVVGANNSITMGASANTNNVQTVTIGNAADSNNARGIALGSAARQDGYGGIAIGYSVTSNAGVGVAIGYNFSNTLASSFQWGTSTQKFTVTANSNVLLNNGVTPTAVTHFDDSATNVITIGTGSAPDANVAHSVQLYAQTGSSEAGLQLRTSGGKIHTLADKVDFTTATAISGSTFSGSFVGDGSGLTGISSTPFPFTGDAQITGSLTISGSFNAFTLDSDNVVLGTLAGSNMQAGADDNVIIGNSAGLTLSTGDRNVFIGDLAGRLNNGSYNVFLGRRAGYENVSNNNVFLGYNAGYNGGGGAANNVAIGNSSMRGAISHGGDYNTAVGYYSLYSINGGKYNLALGYEAGYSVAGGGNNILLGNDAGYSITSGNANIIIGSGSLGSTALEQQLRIGHADVITISGSLETGEVIVRSQRPISTISTNPFTASAANVGEYFRAGGNVTCSIKINATASCPIGAEFDFFQTSSVGNVLFEADPGVTLNSKNDNINLAGQFSSATLKKVGNDEWDLMGDLT